MGKRDTTRLIPKRLVPEGEPDVCRTCQWPALYHISGLLNSEVCNFDGTLTRIMDVAIEITNAQRGLLVLFGDRDETEIKIARDKNKRMLRLRDLVVSRSIINEVTRTHAPVFIQNLQEDKKFRDAPSILDLEILSVMCVPLRVMLDEGLPPDRERRQLSVRFQQRLVGVLYVDSHASARTFSKKDLEVFEALANYATTVLIYAQLHEESRTDPLTGIWDRGHFERAMVAELNLAAKFRYPVSVLMIDVDHFKQVNDLYGHQRGDEVLATVARTLREGIRRVDMCARYGGEEFIVLLSQTDENGAQVVAEKLRRAIQDQEFFEGELTATVSIGVATYPVHSERADEIVAKADQALYKAKRDGRNCVRVWSEELAGSRERIDLLAGVLTGNPCRDRDNVKMLLETIRAVNGMTDSEEMMSYVLDRSIEVTGAERGILLLLDEEGRLGVQAARDRSGCDVVPVPPFSRSIPEAVAGTGVPVCLHDRLADSETDMGKSVQDLDLRAVMCVPLRIRNETAGVIYVDSHTKMRDFSTEDLAFFDAIARELAMALENVRLASEAYKTQVASASTLDDMLHRIEDLEARNEELEAELERLRSQRTT